MLVGRHGFSAQQRGEHSLDTSGFFKVEVAAGQCFLAAGLSSNDSTELPNWATIRTESDVLCLAVLALRHGLAIEQYPIEPPFPPRTIPTGKPSHSPFANQLAVNAESGRGQPIEGDVDLQVRPLESDAQSGVALPHGVAGGLELAEIL